MGLLLPRGIRQHTLQRGKHREHIGNPHLAALAGALGLQHLVAEAADLATAADQPRIDTALVKPGDALQQQHSFSASNQAVLPLIFYTQVQDVSCCGAMDLHLT